VLAAVDDGELAPDRVEAWRQLMAEGLRQEMRRDARLRAELKRTWKSRSKSLRRAGQDPPGPGAL
jgi:ribosome biogenesis GTPase